MFAEDVRRFANVLFQILQIREEQLAESDTIGWSNVRVVTERSCSNGSAIPRLMELPLALAGRLRRLPGVAVPKQQRLIAAGLVIADKENITQLRKNRGAHGDLE